MRFEGVLFDPPMSVLLGVTDKGKIEEYFGLPDEEAQTEAGEVYTYKGRQMEVRFDTSGKVIAFSMRTGALNSGVRIGSPISHWELIYDGAEGVPSKNQSLTFAAKDGRVAEITIGR